MSPALSKQQQPRRGDRLDAAALVVLAVAACAILIRGLIDSHALLGMPGADVTRLFYSLRHFAFKAPLEGLPLWNPHIFFGTPFLAQLQPGLLYPPNWLFVWLPLTVALNVSAALHVFLAGAFMYAYARRLTGGALWALPPALSYMLGSAVLLRVLAGHHEMLCTLPWIPLLFLVVEGILEKRGAWRVLTGSLVLAMMILAGYIQITAFSIAGICLYVFTRLLSICREAHSMRPAWPILGRLVVMGGLGGLLSCAQLLPAAELASNSLRMGTDLAFASSFSLPPENLFTMICPDLFGNRVDVSYWGRGSFLWEMSLYFGIIPFVLALWGAIRSKSGPGRAWLVVALISLVIAFGKYTPIFGLLHAGVPWIGIFRGYSKFNILFFVAMAVLAGYGLKSIAGGGGEEKSRDGAHKLWEIVAGLTVLLLIAMTLVGPDGWQKLMAWSVASAETKLGLPDLTDAFCTTLFLSARVSLYRTILFLGSGLLALELLRRRRIEGISFAIVISVLVLADLFTFGWKFTDVFQDNRAQWPAEVVEVLKEEAGKGRVLNLVDEKNKAILYGIDEAGGNCPAPVDSSVRFFNLAGGLPGGYFNAYGRIREISGLFNLANVRTILSPVPLDGSPFEPLHEGAGFHVYRNPYAMPRAFTAFSAKVLPDAEIPAALLDPEFHPRSHVLLSVDPGIGLPGPDAPHPGAQGAEIVHYEADRVSIHTNNDREGILVLSDTFYPGWRATLDGSETPILRANLAFRGVAIPAGVHLVEFLYDPASFRYGSWISLVALAFVLCGLAVSLPRRFNR